MTLIGMLAMMAELNRYQLGPWDDFPTHQAGEFGRRCVPMVTDEVGRVQSRVKQRKSRERPFGPNGLAPWDREC